MSYIKKSILVFLISGLSFAAFAGEEEDMQRIRKALNLADKGLTLDSIKPSAVAGLYEVISGMQLMYVSADGRFVIDGDIYDTRESKNISATARDSIRKVAVDAQVDRQAITYKAKGETKHKVTIFTDIDCGYCRKMHSQIDEYNKLGIEVSYLFMPRAGIGSPSYRKAVSAVCADNPQQALTDLKAGKTVEDKQCKNNISETFDLARQIGIRGTPGIVTETGQLVPGYRPPDQLIQMLERK